MFIHGIGCSVSRAKFWQVTNSPPIMFCFLFERVIHHVPSCLLIQGASKVREHGKIHRKILNPFKLIHIYYKDFMPIERKICRSLCSHLAVTSKINYSYVPCLLTHPVYFLLLHLNHSHHSQIYNHPSHGINVRIYQWHISSIPSNDFSAYSAKNALSIVCEAYKPTFLSIIDFYLFEPGAMHADNLTNIFRENIIDCLYRAFSISLGLIVMNFTLRSF